MSFFHLTFTDSFMPEIMCYDDHVKCSNTELKFCIGYQEVVLFLSSSLFTEIVYCSSLIVFPVFIFLNESITSTAGFTLMTLQFSFFQSLQHIDFSKFFWKFAESCTSQF